MEQKIICGSQVLVGEDLNSKKDYALFVSGSDIMEIAPAADLRAKYPSIQCIDYGNATVMPGLIDCHTHLDWDCTIPDYVNESQGCESRLMILGLDAMWRNLRSGVTSTRCMGGHFYLDVKYRNYVREGLVRGPRAQASGCGMRSSAGHGYLGIACDGKQAIIDQARQNLLNGVDWMKFYSTGSHYNARGQISSFYTREETAQIIDIAHRCSIPATSHCVGGQGMTDAIECGIDCLEHCYFATDDHIEMMLKSGTWVCLTMSEYFTDKVYMPELMKSRFALYRDIVHGRMRALIGSGVPYTLGTDGMHGNLWQEAVYLTQHGGTNMDALRALTVNGAKLMGILCKTGSLNAGKLADICVVDSDPTSDISSLKRIRAVFQGGELIENE